MLEDKTKQLNIYFNNISELFVKQHKQNKKLKRVIEDIEDWATINFNDELLQFIRKTKEKYEKTEIK